ncbi:MAG: nucleotide exchange factor GrpE [Muribaculaceae bacterium]|nr:nucleotide exchange factor GrpE [Muribaculaceae bacterium]
MNDNTFDKNFNTSEDDVKNFAAEEGVNIEDTVPENMIDEMVEDTTGDSLSEEESLKDQLDKAIKANESMKKDYMFLMAEFDNFRKRTLKEKSEILKNAAESTLKGLLPIVDDFERGLDAIKDSSDVESVKAGMELIYNKLIKYLSSNGVKAIESTGNNFDADLHEAIAMVPAPDESKKGQVIDTVEKGYTLNDKVIRHAKVVVGQ